MPNIKPFIELGKTMLYTGTYLFILYKLTDKTNDHKIHGFHMNGEPIYSSKNPDKKDGDRIYTF